MGQAPCQKKKIRWGMIVMEYNVHGRTYYVAGDSFTPLRIHIPTWSEFRQLKCDGEYCQFRQNGVIATTRI